MDVKGEIGDCIRIHRRYKGLSQEQLAERAGITPKHLYQLEKGKSFASAATLERILKGLRVSLRDLVNPPGYPCVPGGTQMDFLNEIVREELGKAGKEIQKRYTTLRPENQPETGKDGQD